MNISTLDKNIKLKKEDLIKVYLYITLIEKGCMDCFSDRELSILALLYNINGINNDKELKYFSTLCFDKHLTKIDSVQSVRNVLSKARSKGIVKRKSSNNWRIDSSILTPNDNEFMAFRYFLTNYAVQK